jgi:predicted ArsR family transcriptional regulator
MNLAHYLMTPVTPLYDVLPDCSSAHGDENRRKIAERRAEEMATRYRSVMHRKVLSSREIGMVLGISKPLTGLRKLEARGRVRVHHESKARAGRTQLFWEWVK